MEHNFNTAYDEVSGLHLGIMCEDNCSYTLYISEDEAEWRELQRFTILGISGDVEIFDYNDEGESTKWVLYSAEGRYCVCTFDKNAGFTKFSMTKAVCFGTAYPVSGFLMELFGEELRFKAAIPEGGTVGDVHTERDIPSHGISRDISVPCAVTLTLASLEEAVIVSFCGFEIILDPMTNIIKADGRTMPLCADGGGVTVKLFGAYDPVAGSEYAELCTGIEDGYAKAVGSFKTAFSGGKLTLRGEGALSLLTVEKLNPDFYYCTEF